MQNKKLVPYIKEYGDHGCFSYRRLKPTGRWKIESGPYYEDKMFIEHKGFLFKTWIPEDGIVFELEETCEIFQCSVN